MTTAELLELGSRPIRPDAPAGDPGRDAPEFEALQAEVRKLELPEQPAINWDAAVNAAAVLLGQKSKDLLVASYLCIGLYEQQGVAGLVAGLTVMKDLVGNFWETLYPELKRLRGRQAAIEWLAERGAQAVLRKPPRAAEAEALKQCTERLAELDEKLGPLFDSPPLLGDLRRALEEAATRARPSAPPPAAAAMPAAAPAGPAAVGSAQDVDAALTEARRLLRAAGDFLRKSEPKNPLGYRLPRVAVWMNIKQLPPHTDGKTEIPPPQPADSTETLRRIQASANWAALLEETEGRLATAVFWLDLHYLAHAALEGLGEGYEAAAEAVRDEVRFLLRRFPGLPELRFANDQPLAAPETRAWIRDRVLGAGGEEAAAPAQPAGAPAVERGGEGFEKARAEAWKLARERKLADAVALLGRGADQARRLRDRVWWRLEAARLLLDRGQAETALAQLEGLDTEIQRSTVEAWDPEVCAEVIKSLLVCRQKALSSSRPQSADEYQRTRELLGRLCRLDLVAALELQGRK